MKVSAVNLRLQKWLRFLFTQDGTHVYINCALVQGLRERKADQKNCLTNWETRMELFYSILLFYGEWNCFILFILLAYCLSLRLHMSWALISHIDFLSRIRFSGGFFCWSGIDWLLSLNLFLWCDLLYYQKLWNP